MEKISQAFVREGCCGKGDGLLPGPLWALLMGLFQPISTCADNKR